MRAFDRRRLVGTWQLERWSVTGVDGSVTEAMGPGARGLLVFTADGWATITITAVGRIVAYCCRWRVVGRTVELHVLLSQNPAMEGTVQVRRLRMRGRVLEVLSTAAAGGEVREHCLRWRPAVASADLGATPTKSRRSGNHS